MDDKELAIEIERRVLGSLSATPPLYFDKAEWQQIIAALRRAPEPDVEPFCWWRTTRDITDEYVTVYSDDGTRPEGEGWKPLYERPPSDEMGYEEYHDGIIGVFKMNADGSRNLKVLTPQASEQFRTMLEAK